MRFRLVVDGERWRVEVEQGPAGVVVRIDGAEYRGKVRRSDDGVAVRFGSTWSHVRLVGRTAVTDEGTHEIAVSEIEAETPDARAPGRTGRIRPLSIRATMAGRVVRVVARAGIEVKRGDAIVVLEAMKMQNEIAAPQDAFVKEIRVEEGDSVTADQIVAVLEAR